VYLHGSAGDLAAAAEGQVAMTATDVVRHLGAAWRRLANAGPSAPERRDIDRSEPGL
jgi:hypothetical protein